MSDSKQNQTTPKTQKRLSMRLSENEIVTCRVSLAGGITLELTMRAITVQSLLPLISDLMRTTSTDNAPPVIRINLET